MKNKTTSSLPSAKRKPTFSLLTPIYPPAKPRSSNRPATWNCCLTRFPILAVKKSSFRKPSIKNDCGRISKRRRSWYRSLTNLEFPRTIARWLAKSTTKSCWRLMADSSTTSSKRNAANWCIFKKPKSLNRHPIYDSITIPSAISNCLKQRVFNTARDRCSVFSISARLRWGRVIWNSRSYVLRSIKSDWKTAMASLSR